MHRLVPGLIRRSSRRQRKAGCRSGQCLAANAASARLGSRQRLQPIVLASLFTRSGEPIRSGTAPAGDVDPEPCPRLHHQAHRTAEHPAQRPEHPRHQRAGSRPMAFRVRRINAPAADPARQHAPPAARSAPCAFTQGAAPARGSARPPHQPECRADPARCRTARPRWRSLRCCPAACNRG